MQNFDEIISKLRMTSKDVCNYLDTQGYLVDNDEDSVSRQFIVNECYTIVVEELSELGIIFHCSSEELYSNFYDMENLITIRKLFSIPEMYQLLSTDHELKTKILTLAEVDDNFVINLLHLLSNNDSEDTNRAYTFLWDKISNDSRFIDYITGISELKEDTTIPDLQDESSHIIKSVSKGRRSATTLFDIAMEVDPSLDQKRLAHDLELYDLDKLQPNTINKYGWRASVDRDTLSDEEKAIYDKYTKLHNEANNHHIEFYELKDPMIISKEDIVNLLANRFDESESKAILALEMDKIFERLEKIHTVPKEVKQLVSDILKRLQLPA